MKNRIALSRLGGAKLLAAAIGVACLCAGARAQIIDCPGSASDGRFQVFMDEMSLLAPEHSEEALTSLMDKLQFFYRGRLEALSVESGSATPVSVIYCEGRKPQTDAEFDEDLVDALDDNNVVLELWGTLEETDEGGTLQREARIFYVLVPVLLDNMTESPQPGVQVAEYVGGDGAIGEFTDLLEDIPDVETFFAAGMGINLLRNRKYDEAIPYFCQARWFLGKETGTSPSRDALQSYLDASITETLERAKNDPDYDGPLKEDLFEAADICPEE